jgi:amino acid transporter
LATPTQIRPAAEGESGTGDQGVSGHGLHKGALGHFDSLAQSISTMAPTASAAMTVPLVFSSAGNGTWISYLLATLCTLFVGLCIARFAKDSASPGSLYSYATSSLPPVLGSVAAWALLLAYIASGASVVGGFVHYAKVVLSEFTGHTLPEVPLGIACVALSAWVAYRDVKASARLMLYIELVSVLVISSVFALLLWQHGLHVDASQLSLHGVNFSGVRLGLVLAMFSFVGFESATTLGEEVRNPLRTIPRAVIQSAIISGMFFMVASYAEVLAFPASAGTLDQSDAPLSVLAKVAGVARLGPFIDVCAMITMLSCTLACVTAAARVLLLMAHNGLVPGRLKSVHARNRTPHMAVMATAVVTMLLSVPLSVWKVSGETIYDWMGSLATYGFLVVYALVAVALPLYLKARQKLTYSAVALSVLAVAAMALVLAGTLYPVPEAPKNWLPYIFLLYLAVAAGINGWQARKPRVQRSPVVLQ